MKCGLIFWGNSSYSADIFIYNRILLELLQDAEVEANVEIHLKFDVSSTVHQSTELFHQPTLMHNFYSFTICLLHYYPRHVLSINMPIFRRKNCIHTASGIFALNQCTGQMFTDSKDTRCCVNTIFPPEDGHVNAQNMSRIIM